jgi:hypothetical protein
MRKLAVALAALLVLSIAASSAKAASVAIEGLQASYAAGKPFTGSVRVTFDRLLPADAKLVALVDGSFADSLYLEPYLNGTYQFRSYQFSYNITANGKSEWSESPAKQFSYRLSASGTCGSQECVESGMCDCAGLCTPPNATPYNCAWSLTYTYSLQSSVSAAEGLKFIADGDDYIFPPVSSNQDTKWSEILNNPTSPYGVQTTMREACGGADYLGLITEPNGWVKRSLPLESFEGVPGTTNRRILIEPFDQLSLTTDRTKFIDVGCSSAYVCGGVYRNGIAMTGGYSANGSTGEIVIYNFDPAVSYAITYMPPEGSRLCAYSTERLTNSSTWSRQIPQTGTISYDKPFSKAYTSSQLPSVFNSSNRVFVNPPTCPSYASECVQTATSYGAVKTSDPSGSSISVSFSSQSRTASASLSSPDLVSSYTKSISMSNFTGLLTPTTKAVHTIVFVLQSSTGESRSPEASFSVCADADNDGYCSDNDCNDTDSGIHPEAKELCNQKDDDCDSQVDEDFQEAGKTPGSSCGIGACTGKWMCSADKKSVICSAPASPGKEICKNEVDDDCDGAIDELYEDTPTGPGIGCICKDGERKPCGSNVGECRQGYQVCASGQWTKVCYQKTGPFEETCNNKDDDCNGLTDDVSGGDSVASSSCGCYGGGYPSMETCDSVDNDCNGLVDDGVSCCTMGSTRACGPNKGICSQGTQACDSSGQWGECTGGVSPDPEGEICTNDLDDNCNGVTDEENCRQSVCTGLGCDMSYGWLLVAGGTIIIILTVAFVELRKK